MRLSVTITMILLMTLAACSTQPSAPSDPFADENVAGQAAGQPLGTSAYAQPTTQSTVSPQDIVVREGDAPQQVLVTARDDAIWNRGYIYLPGHANAITSGNGAGWVPFEFQAGQGSRYITNMGMLSWQTRVDSSIDMQGKSPLAIVYSCSRAQDNSWDCGTQKWQGLPFTFTKQAALSLDIESISSRPASPVETTSSSVDVSVDATIRDSTGSNNRFEYQFAPRSQIASAPVQSMTLLNGVAYLSADLTLSKSSHDIDVRVRPVGANQWQAADSINIQVTDPAAPPLSVQVFEVVTKGQGVPSDVETRLFHSGLATFDADFEWQVDWGDQSTPSTGTAASGMARPAHTYATAGQYTATAQIKKNGASNWEDSQTLDITVSEVDAVGITGFTVDGVDVNDGDTVRVTEDQIVNFGWTVDAVSGNPSQWSYRIIDTARPSPAISYGDVPSLGSGSGARVFTTPGSTTVRLDVYNGFGRTNLADSVSITVNVQADSPSNPSDPFQ